MFKLTIYILKPSHLRVSVSLLLTQTFLSLCFLKLTLDKLLPIEAILTLIRLEPSSSTVILTNGDIFSIFVIRLCIRYNLRILVNISMFCIRRVLLNDTSKLLPMKRFRKFVNKTTLTRKHYVKR